MLKSLDVTVDHFIKLLFNNYNFNECEQLLFSLLPKFAALGIIILSHISDDEFDNSRLITDVMEKIKGQTTIYKNEGKSFGH